MQFPEMDTYFKIGKFLAENWTVRAEVMHFYSTYDDSTVDETCAPGPTTWVEKSQSLQLQSQDDDLDMLKL